jgi:hypothetical protein
VKEDDHKQVGGATDKEIRIVIATGAGEAEQARCQARSVA